MEARVQPPGLRVGIAVGAGALLLAGAGLAAAVQAVGIPSPALEAVEPEVRQKIEALRRRVAALPKDGALWGRYGMALEAHDFVAEAAVAYREASAADAGEFRWPYFLAALLELRDPSAAVEWLQRAIDLDSAYAPARIRFGELLEELAQWESARAQFERARSLAPRNPFAYFGLGRIALQEGRIEDAVRNLESAYDLQPEVKALAATLSQAYYRSGRREPARQLARESRTLGRITLRPDPRHAEIAREAVDLDSFLRRAGTYRRLGRLDEALREIRVALARQPERAEAHYVAAEIYDALGDAPSAVAEARKTLELAAGMEDIRPVLAGNLVKARRFEEAAIEAKRVLEEHPRDVRMWLTLAMVALDGRDLDGLVDSLDEAYDIGTANSGMRLLLLSLIRDLAAVLADSGRFAEAATRMEHVVDLSEQAAEAPSVRAAHGRRLESYRRGEVVR